jgi:hypothetical protein
MPEKAFGFDKRSVKRISDTVIRVENSSLPRSGARARTVPSVVIAGWQVTSIDLNYNILKAKRLKSDGTLDDQEFEFARYTGDD